jgi:hypothetical protein
MPMLFVWSGDPARLPLLVVREAGAGRTVGLFVVIGEKAELRSFDALQLRSLGLDPGLRPSKPSAGFGAVEPSAVPGRGVASRACRPVSYEQIGHHLAPELFEALGKT